MHISRLPTVLWLAKESCSDIAHVLLLEFIVLALIGVNSNKLKGGYDALYVEAHLHKAVH